MKQSFCNAVILLIFPFIFLNAQSPELKETFLEAESYFLFEEYSEALPLYLRIHRAAPENNNINYKIGICFLNDPYQKEKSISYLEKATKDITGKYKENNFKETTAPLEAYFYLGNAYLVNNDIEKALENYQHFREILDERIYDVELVEEQIKICNQARELMKKPVDFEQRNLNEVINGRFADINPIVSGDGTLLVYVSERQFYDATFFSQKVNGEWQPPRNIIPELGVDGDVYPTCLSWDGKTMIIYRNDEFIGNLYVSHYVNERWTEMKKLGPNINTKYWESHGSLSKDGNTLYFTSNRKDGFGGLDIYKSSKLADGTWGPAINLGAEINTRYNEETPFLTEDGKTLYFSSYGHYNMGGYDVFYSRIDKNGKWGNPINLGYPINTTDDNTFFLPVNNGSNAYYSQYLENGYGRHDIYYLEVYSENNPRMYIITGSLGSDKGLVSEEDDLMIYLIDHNTGDTIALTQPDLSTQRFQLKAPKGDYDLLMHSSSFNDLITRIRIGDQTDKTGISIADQLKLETKPYEAQVLTGSDSRIILEDTVFNPQAGKKLKLKLRLEKGSTLFADHSVNNMLIASDTFKVDKKRFTYELTPESGINTIDFIMIEENGDKSLKKIEFNVEEGKRSVAVESKPQALVSDSLPEKDVLPKNDSAYILMQEKTDRLAGLASGDLKNILDTLDLHRLGITNEKLLYDHLKSIGIPEEKLLDLRAISKTNNKADELLKLMLQQSTGELHKFLKTVDADSLGLKNAADLLDYIRKSSENNPFSNEQINTVLRKVINNTPPPVDKTLKELMSYATGDLKEYIQNIDLEKEKISNPSDLLDHLANQAGDAYAPELLISVLTDMVGDRSLDSFIEYIKLNGPESLAKLLNKLDLKKEGIKTISDLIAYLLNHKEELGLTQEELQALIIDLMADFTIAPILDADPIMQDKGISGEMFVTGGLLLAGILIFILFFARRRKKNEESA